MPVLTAALSFILAGQMTAQTFTTLYSFGFADGGDSHGGLILSGHILYGTTANYGRLDHGTVFSVKIDGTGFVVLHTFFGSSDGANPSATLLLADNTLFGTAYYGGSSGWGTLFKLNIDGTGFTTLHSFTRPNVSGNYANSDGVYPNAGLILSGNILYGAASEGGSSGKGTVFKLNTDGTGFTVLHNFTVTVSQNHTNSDGAYPLASLILLGNTLYGTANQGGSAGWGTVFKLNTDGTSFTTLHNFGNGSINPLGLYTNSSGVFPFAGLILAGNTLYGTAQYGGSSGNGTVFKVDTDGTGFTTLHSFTAALDPYYTNSDGLWPRSVLALSGNTLYGTAENGGSSGNGTLFSVNADGTGFTNLHSFTAHLPGTNSDGANPFGGLILSGKTLYGTTGAGGSSGYGTVFSLSLGLSPPTIVCSTPLILECTRGAAVGTIQAETQDTNGNPIQVVWTIDGISSQTNNISSGGTITASNVTLTANFELGQHVVVVSASNGQTDPVTCSTTVTVHDTTPPQIVNIVATPNVLWPPNHRMVPVNVMVDAVDNCDPSPVARITNVICNEPQNPLAPDWQITGAQSLNLRAERLGEGHGRIYTIVVQCKDLSGNVSTASVDVTAPHN